MLLLTVLFLFCSFLQKKHPERALLPNKENIVLVFAGDIMGHSPQFKAALNAKTGKYNYEDCFVHVKPYIEEADFAVANLGLPWLVLLIVVIRIFPVPMRYSMD